MKITDEVLAEILASLPASVRATNEYLRDK